MNHKKSLLQSPVSVGFVSLGCAKNLVDSQIMAGVLLSEGIVLAPSPEESDIVIVNTCAFIREAREESVGAILSARRLKESGRCKAVLVAGCLPQRYRDNLRTALPEVDAFIGLDELERIGEIVKRLANGERAITVVSSDAPKKLFDPRRNGIVFTNGPYAYLKIAEGCNHRCAFCAIPSIRGGHRSRSINSIVAEAEKLLERGIGELNLISQDVTSYGRDLRDRRVGLPQLLRAIGGIGGKFWIRLLYGYPSGVSDELLDAMGEVAQVCPYLDLPIQHSAPEILRFMKRAETIEHVRGFAGSIRRKMPDIALRTTCLVGFPGEKRAHFENLLEFLTETRFDNVGVFVFSPEENTKAFNMPERPSRRTAERRRERLMLEQKKVVDAKAAELIGSEAEVLLERRRQGKNNIWIARTMRQAPEVDGETFVEGVPEGTPAGSFVRTRFISQNDYDMNAVFANTNPRARTSRQTSRSLLAPEFSRLPRVS